MNNEKTNFLQTLNAFFDKDLLGNNPNTILILEEKNFLIFEKPWHISKIHKILLTKTIKILEETLQVY